MKFIYVKNYLGLSRESKIYFLKFLNEFEEIRITNQKILLNDNSILFEFSKETDITFVAYVMNKFFKNVSDLQVIPLQSILMQKDTLTLVIKKQKRKRIIL